MPPRIDVPATTVFLIAASPAEAARLRATLAEASQSHLRFEVVDGSGDAEADLARLASGGIDILLLDLAEVGERGLDLLVRARIEAPDIPVVVLTGSGERDELLGVEAVQAGAQDYVPKSQLGAGLLARLLRYAMERQRLQATLRQLSLTDELTGLYNRRGFLTLSEHHIRFAHRTRGLLLVTADIDGLRAINDQFGRDEGDRALVAASAVLRDTFRASDVVARFASDDFAVLVLDAADEAADVVGARLRARLDRFNHGARYALELRIGSARFRPGMPPAVDELLARAHESLAAEKQRARA